MKIDQGRILRDREMIKKETEEFLKWKKVVDQEYIHQKAELEKDYLYIEDQLKYIEKMKGNYEQMNGKLEQYSQFLSDQDRIHNQQRNKFYKIQSDFFKKIKQMASSSNDLKRLEAEIVTKEQELERQRDDVNMIQKKMNLDKGEFDQALK